LVGDLLVGFIGLGIVVLALDRVLRGSLDTASSVSALPFAWPAPPDSLWSRGLDLVAAATLILATALYVQRLYRTERDVSLPLVVAVMAVIVALSRNHGAMIVALLVGMEVLRSAAGEQRPRWRARRKLGLIGGFAAVWLVVCAGVVFAANNRPIVAQPGVTCGSWGGTGIEGPSGGAYGNSGSLVYAYKPGDAVVPVLCVENRSWTRSATILSVAYRSLPNPGPWHAAVVDYPVPTSQGFRIAAPIRLRPNSTREVDVRITFAGCTDTLAGQTFTLAAIPLLVRTGGGVQVDSVRLSQPMQTRCP